MAQWVNVAGQRRVARQHGLHLRVVKERPSANHQDPFATPYRVHMSDGDKRESWADYLRRMTTRPGWSVARLARESGIHRATIFRWIGGQGGATVTSVSQIADALGDEPANALRAAGNMAGVADEMPDPDLQLLMRRLANPDVPETEKAAIRTALRYLAEMAEQAERAERERPAQPSRVVRRRRSA
jgi:transposase-like protein